MVEWWNGRMMDEMAEWWNGGMVEWRNGNRMAEWRNCGMVMEWRNGIFLCKLKKSQPKGEEGKQR